MNTTQQSADDKDQREALLESERRAHPGRPRDVKQDAKDKIVSVEPDGTGPTSTGSFDAQRDQALNSGSDPVPPGPKAAQGPG